MFRVLAVMFIAIIAALRFARPDMVFFYVDEALLFQIAERTFATGVWPLHGLPGTKGIFYGPVPAWIYSTLRHFVTEAQDLAVGGFLLNAALQLGTLIYFLGGVFKLFPRHIAVLVTALILVSPYLFFYSRTVWDNVYLICCANLFGGYLLRLEAAGLRAGSATKIGYLGVIYLGVVVGLALGIHLMSLPVVAGAAYILWSSPGTLHSKGLKLTAAAVVAVMILAPYLIEFSSLESIPGGAASFQIRKIPTGLRDTVTHWSGWVSWAQFFRYSIGADYRDVIASSFTGGPVWLWLMDLGRVIQLAWALGLLILFWRTIFLFAKRQLWPSHSRLKLVMAIMVGSHVTMAVLKDATSTPHYFQAVWWVPFVMLGQWLSEMSETRQLRQNAFIALQAVVGLNFLSLLIYCGLVFHFNGMKGTHFGPSLRLQQQAVRELCEGTPANATRTVDLSNGVIAPAAFSWISSVTSECKGTVLELKDVGPRVQIAYDWQANRPVTWKEIP